MARKEQVSNPNKKTSDATSLTTFTHRSRDVKKLTTKIDPSSILMPNFDCDIPKLVSRNSSEEINKCVRHLGMLMYLLNYYVRCYESAVQLYEYSANQIAVENFKNERNPLDKEADETLELVDGWPIVACRDGAMSIYHFGKIFEGIHYELSQNSSLINQVDTDNLKKARSLFDQHFSNFSKMRDAVCHSGDKLRKQANVDEHSFEKDWSNGHISFERGAVEHQIILIDVLSSRKYSNSWQGEVFSYSIGIETLILLAECRDLIFKSFNKLMHP